MSWILHLGNESGIYSDRDTRSQFYLFPTLADLVWFFFNQLVCKPLFERGHSTETSGLSVNEKYLNRINGYGWDFAHEDHDVCYLLEVHKVEYGARCMINDGGFKEINNVPIIHQELKRGTEYKINTKPLTSIQVKECSPQTLLDHLIPEMTAIVLDYAFGLDELAKLLWTDKDGQVGWIEK
jgi:hypothetical protein